MMAEPPDKLADEVEHLSCRSTTRERGAQPRLFGDQDGDETRRGMNGGSGPGFDTIGKRLRAARIKAGLSQADVEALSGIPKARISRYEHDHVEPSIGSLVKLCIAVGEPPSAIIDHHYQEALGAAAPDTVRR
jgi:DNA-binding XRE family transcriptional regulator